MKVITTDNIGRATRQDVEHLVQAAEHKASPSASERRREPRVALNAPVQLGVCLAGSDAFTALYDGWGLDVSIHGVGVLVEDPIPTQLRLCVDFESVAGHPFVVPARVLYCRQLLSHTYHVGAVFVWLSGD